MRYRISLAQERSILTSVEVSIIADTTACIPQEQVEKLDIELVPIELVFGDRAYRDGVDITPAQFYALLRQAKELPTTVGALPGSYLGAYERASRKARSILCITEPSKLSGMFNAARIAAEMARESLSGVTIKVLESTTAAAGLGLVALAAARTAAAGADLATVVAAGQRVMDRAYLFATLDTLYYLIKGGRVPKVAGLANSILKIKPVLSVNEGDAHVVALPRTTGGAMRQILRKMREKVVKGRPVHVAVMHADAPELADALKAQVAARFSCTELFITEFTPVMGVHTGPGVVGVAFYSE